MEKKLPEFFKANNFLNTKLNIFIVIQSKIVPLKMVNN
jgi:hypothetical protein